MCCRSGGKGSEERLSSSSVVVETGKTLMLVLYLPYLVLDATLDLCAASISMWQLVQSDPVIFVMEEKAGCR